MSPQKFAPALLVLISSGLAVLTGCGGDSSRQLVNGNNSNSTVPGYTTGTGGTPSCTGVGCGTTTTGTGTTGTGTTTTTTTASLPPLTYSFSLTGPGGSNPTYTTPAITTDSILTVRITAAPAGQLSAAGVAYSNFSSTYNCIAYTISAIGESSVTQPLSVGYGSATSLCPGASQSQVIDFSGRLTPGHGPVTIQVSQPLYDFYCNLLEMGWVYGTYSMFCPLHTVYKNHTVTGSLSIQVNGTTGP